MSGKGSSPRPFSVDQKTFAENWAKKFNNKSTDHKSLDQELFGPVSEHENCGTPECCGECTEDEQ